MEFQPIKLKKLFDANFTKKLVLPNFQRSYVWDTQKQSTLLASFLLGLPIGNLLILEGNKNDFSSRALCFPDRIEPNDECSYLLDGQQRISTLRNIFSNLYKSENKWEDVYTKLPPQLNYRWFIKLSQIEETDDNYDFLGYNELRFNKSRIESLEPSQLKNSFIPVKILKKNRSNYFHPDYRTNDGQGGYKSEVETRNEIAKLCANEQLIPLYEVYSKKELPTNPLHELVIQRIAATRINDLRTTITDTSLIADYLKSVDTEIESIIKKGDKEKINQLWTKLEMQWATKTTEFLNGLVNQNLAQILLGNNEQQRAWAIFETINEGGTALDDFDLIVARAARNAELDQLTKRIFNELEKEITLNKELTSYSISPPKKLSTKKIGLYTKTIPTKTLKSWYLYMLSIYSRHGYGQPENIDILDIKKKRILELSTDEINDNTNVVLHAIRKAVAFLNIRCGITDISNMPYKLMMLPIAYAFLDKANYTSKSKLNKIEYWYWCSIFGGFYRDNQNSKAKNDIKNLYNFLNGSDNIFANRYKEIFNASKYSDFETLALSTQRKEDIRVSGAIQKAISQYILSLEPKDLLDDNFRLAAWKVANNIFIEYDNKEVVLKFQDHHIYPINLATKLKESSKIIRSDKGHRLNSPLNRTYISSLANRMISDSEPKKYFQQVSNTAKTGHCIQSPIDSTYTKEKNESEDDFYIKLLKSRYEKIKETINDELEKLIE